MNLTEISTTLQRRVGSRETTLARLNKSREIVVRTSSRLHHAQKAQAVVQEVAQQTQQELEYHVSELVTLALSTVFAGEEDYEVSVDFIVKRAKTECEISLLTAGGEPISPMGATGGGVVDVAAFAFRVSLWCLKNPRRRNCLILDEPFRQLSTDLQKKASKMLKELSERLGLQFIIVTHEEELLDAADLILKVTKKNKKSKVEKIQWPSVGERPKSIAGSSATTVQSRTGTRASSKSSRTASHTRISKRRRTKK